MKLTPSEREVWALMARGLSNKQIAYELVYEVRTVGNMLSKVYAKLSITSGHKRVKAAVMYWTRKENEEWLSYQQKPWKQWTGVKSQ